MNNNTDEFCNFWAWLLRTLQHNTLQRSLHKSRVINIPHNLYADFFDRTLESTFEIPAFMEHTDATERQELLRQSFNENTERMNSLLPFDCTFLSFGSRGIELANSIWKTARMNLVSVADGVPVDTFDQYTYTILGFLCVRNERVTEFFTLSGGDLPQDQFHLRTLSAQLKGNWTNPFSLDGGVIPAIIDYINDHRTIVQRAPSPMSYRRRFAKAAKNAGMKKAIPPAYYNLELSTNVVTEIEESIATQLASIPRKTSCKTFQGDVRQHERVKFHRGPLPLQPQDKLRLEKLQYRIYEKENLSDDDARRLAVRTIPAKSDSEWIAIKHSTVKAHKSPSDARAHELGLEYKPAIRTVQTRIPVRTSTRAVKKVDF